MLFRVKKAKIGDLPNFDSFALASLRISETLSSIIAFQCDLEPSNLNHENNGKQLSCNGK